MPIHLLNTSTTNLEYAVKFVAFLLGPGQSAHDYNIDLGALSKVMVRSGNRSHFATQSLESTPRRIVGLSEGRELHSA